MRIRKFPAILVASTIFLLGFLGSTPSFAATITVTNLDDTGVGSLRWAISQAETNMGGDIIMFQAGLSGTIQLTSVGSPESALPKITESLDIIGPGADQITVDASMVGLVRIFLLDDGDPGVSQYTISGLTLTGGDAQTGVPETDGGGAIFMAGGDTLSLKDCDISGNKASGSEGGALMLGENASVTIENCDIHNNQAIGGATGAISNVLTGSQGGGALSIINSQIRDNSTTSAAGALARLGGSLSIVDSTISGNTAVSNGGGMLIQDPGDNSTTVLIENSTIDNNKVTNGQIGGLAINAVALIRNSTISNNEAFTNRGGILVNGTVDMVNSTVSGNKAGANGGGIATSNNGTLNLFNVTVSNNTADSDGSGDGDGGGIYVGNGTTLNMQNSILAGNSDPTSAPDCSGTLNSQGYNLIGTNENCDFVSDGTDQVGTPTAPIDPLLGSLAANGGPTQTQALLDGSPAIDAANPAGCLDESGTALTTDQRGEPRPGAGSNRCDVGSYEFQATPPPTPPSGGGGCALAASPKASFGGLLLVFGLLAFLSIRVRLPL